MSDLFFAEPGNKSFIIFNAQALSDDAITEEDMILVVAHGAEMEAARSAAWSSNIWRYFVILNAGIILMDVDTNRGILCRKRSWKFIDAFVDPRRRAGA
jgi:hypothetical protein